MLAGVLAAAASGASSADPGVEDSRILLGATAPLSGSQSAAAAVSRGASAYFRYVNARGGVNGRTIAYQVADDGSDPQRAVEETQRLVEGDGVFAIVNAVGTDQNVATRDYLNAAKVPQLFVGSGARTFGSDYRRYPWTIGFQPSHEATGWIHGSFIARTRPGAKIALLYQDEALGTELLAGLKRGLARSKVRVLASEPVAATPADLQAQLATLKASGADVLALFVAPADATRAYGHVNRLGWRPLIVTDAASRVESAISIAFLKDPADPRWRSDPAITLYRSIMARHARGANVKDVHHVHGMAVAYQTVELLKAAGKDPTRAGLIAQTRKLNDASNPFLLPGIAIKTSATERFPIEQALLQRWSKGSWKSFGGLWGYRAR